MNPYPLEVQSLVIHKNINDLCKILKYNYNSYRVALPNIEQNISHTKPIKEISGLDEKINIHQRIKEYANCLKIYILYKSM